MSWEELYRHLRDDHGFLIVRGAGRRYAQRVHARLGCKR